MHGINAKLPKRYFKCYMCSKQKFQDVYIWGSFEILPKHPYLEIEICKKCATREHGKRTKLEDVIKERTKKWLNQRNQKQSQ